ncbi:MAG: permease [Candidatus Asgardarchaeum californiense]|nr:MAG: permease [Candidatus Asgardarchaeum californiense]
MNNIKKEKMKGKNKTLYYGLSFFIFVIILYIVLFFFNDKKTYNAVHASINIFIQILPVLALVIFLMGISNYFLKPKTVSKYLGEESGIKGWLIAVSLGILSHGSIYVWYPLLKDLQDHGMRVGLIATFLYNRAVKIPLLPIMIYYFGIIFVFILTIYMIIISVVEGKLIEMILNTFENRRARSD